MTVSSSNLFSDHAYERMGPSQNSKTMPNTNVPNTVSTKAIKAMHLSVLLIVATFSISTLGDHDANAQPAAPSPSKDPIAKPTPQPLAPATKPPVAEPAPKSAPKKASKTGARILVDRVVAVINDEVILHSELMRRVVPLSGDIVEINDPRERARKQAKLKDQVVDDMIAEELIVQAAKASKLEVNAKEVATALADIKKQNNLDETQFAEALRMQGYSMSGYRRDVRRQLLRFRAVTALVRPRVAINDEEVKARYEEMRSRTAAIKKVKLSHVLIALPENPSSEQIAEAKAKAATALERARGGEDFATVAQRLSDDDATKASGGDLGWIERGSIATEWEVIVFAMKKGETRGPINGPRGLHVFHVADVEKSEDKTLEEVKDQIRGALLREGMDRETRRWLAELRKKAHVQKKL